MAFHALEKLSQLYDGYQKPFRIGGHKLLLVQHEGRNFLIEDRCPHMDASLADATQHDGCLRCRVHGIDFQLSDGSAAGPLAGVISPLKFYPIVYDGNTLGVDL